MTRSRWMPMAGMLIRALRGCPSLEGTAAWAVGVPGTATSATTSAASSATAVRRGRVGCMGRKYPGKRPHTPPDSDLAQPRQHRAHEPLRPRLRVATDRRADRDQGDAQGGVLLHRREEGVGVVDRVEPAAAADGLADLGVVAADVLAVLLEHLELVRDPVDPLAREQV